MDKFDLAILLLRLSLGASIAAHGLNKVLSPSGITGTAGWFSSIGMKWPLTQARLAAGSEVVAGAFLCAGLFTSFSCMVIISLMVVAIVTVHLKVGYFIFLPNGGWEYCASIIAVSASLAIAGPGSASLDSAWNLPTLPAIASLILGIVFPLCHLALSFRPSKP